MSTVARQRARSRAALGVAPSRRRVRSVAVPAAAAGATVVGAYVLAGRGHQLGWGATAEEASAALPGDGLVGAPDLVATRGIEVAAPPQDVWPWIAQLGQGRGGFYSYDWLENLAGCDIHSAEQIVPEWQDPQVGDEVRLHPDVALEVAVVQPPQALVLQGGVPARGTQGQVPYEFSWAFVVRAVGGGRSRLLVRERYRYMQRWAAALVEPVAVVSFVMTRKMLQGIKERVERAGAPAPLPADRAPATGASGSAAPGADRPPGRLPRRPGSAG